MNSPRALLIATSFACVGLAASIPARAGEVDAFRPPAVAVQEVPVVPAELI